MEAVAQSRTSSHCFIIEQISRSGQVIHCYTYAVPAVSIGRAYDQQLRLDDDFIDPAHLLLTLDPSTSEVTCVDLNSLNGISLEPKVGKRQRVSGAAVIRSGDVLVIGRTRLRILLPNQPIAPTLKLTASHRYLALIGTVPLSIVITVCIAAFTLLNGYLSAPTEFKAEKQLFNSFYTCLFVAGYAAVWSFIGRSFKKESRFFLQYFLAALVTLCVAILNVVIQWLSYHFAYPEFWPYVKLLLPAFSLFLAIFWSLRLATRLSVWQTYAAAIVIPIFMASSSLMKVIESANGIKPVPYHKALVAPSFNLRSTISSKSFLESSRGYDTAQDSQILLQHEEDNHEK